MTNLTSEEKARIDIDRRLDLCGWSVQDYRAMNISAARGVAVREFPLSTGFADYLLYAEGKAIGVVEAKPAGHTLTGVETQSGKYLDGFPAGLPHYRLPLPFAYESMMNPRMSAAETVIENSLLRAARFRQSILKRAFEGKLVPQDPSDEPASALLERIRAATTNRASDGTSAKAVRQRRPRSNSQK